MTVIDSEFAQADATMLRTPPPSMVERMTRILEAFDASIARLTLEEVTFRSGLPRSTVHRILEQLVRLDWLEHSALGYGLGSRALGLGGDIDRDRLRECAAPHLHELAMQTGGVVHLDVLDGGQVYCLDKVGGAGAAGLPTRVGGRTAAYATAGGKAMLATLDPEQVDSLYPSRLAPATHHTITDRVVLHQELNRVRKRHGIAFDREESIVGIGSVGAPCAAPAESSRVCRWPVACARSSSNGWHRWSPTSQEDLQRARVRGRGSADQVGVSVAAFGRQNRIEHETDLQADVLVQRVESTEVPMLERPSVRKKQ